MNSYILVGLLSPLLRASTNYLDKFLLDKVTYPTKHVIPVLLIFSSLIGLCTGLITFFIGFEEIILLSAKEVLLLMLTGVLGVLGIYVYLVALGKDSPTNVVPFFQLIPLFALFIGYYLFSEAIVGVNLVGVVLVVIGSMLLSADLSTFRIHRPVIGLMALSGLLFTFRDAFFRILYTDSSFSVSVFGLSLGLVSCGCLLLSISKFRKGFIDTVVTNGKHLVGLNLLNGSLNMGGKLIFFYISTYVYLAHLELLNSLQPLFILIIGFILSKISPETFEESVTKKERRKQVVSIVLMMIGVLLITL